jgi:preprotein translocase subunit YajC
MLTSFLLFAQENLEKGTDKGPQDIGDFLKNPMFMIMILFALFFFVVILPGQRRRAKEQEQLLSGMKKNDEVQTAAGIIGTIYAIKEGDEVVLKIDDNARIRVLKSSIVRIIKKDETATAPAPAPTTPNSNAKPNA